MSEAANISKSILWRTRGKSWDYCFVLRPQVPRISNPYRFYAQVFADGIASREVNSVGGWFYCGDSEKIPFVASTFVDPVFTDDSARPIVHYLAWFNVMQVVENTCSVAKHWAEGFVKSLQRAWNECVMAEAGPGTELAKAAAQLSWESIAGKASVSADSTVTFELSISVYDLR